MGPKSDKKGGGGGVKRKHVQLSIKDKLKILDQLENGTKPGVISLEFGIAKQTISDIKRNGEKLRKYAAENSEESKGGKRNVGLERTRVQYGKSAHLDEAVIKWQRQQLGVGVGVRGVELKAAAGRLAMQLGIENFKASDGWLFRFRTRFGLHNKHMRGEASSAPQEDVEPFRKKLMNLINEEGLVYAQVRFRLGYVML